MFNLSYDAALSGLIIFVRISAILFTLPIFGDEPTPIRVRVLLAIALSFIVYTLIMPKWLPELPKTILGLALVLVKEVTLGVMIGYIARLFFDGIVMAASLVGYQMGFGTANLLIPDANMQMNSFTALHRILLMLIFLSLNLHHQYVSAIVDSFRLISAGAINFQGSLGELFITTSAAVFTVAVQLSAPVLVALMFTMAALGLVARSVPQMNIFTMSFPTSFFVGLIIYVGSLPYFPEMVKRFFLEAQSSMDQALSYMRP